MMEMVLLCVSKGVQSALIVRKWVFLLVFYLVSWYKKK